MARCDRCHACGTLLRPVLAGEEWCPHCDTYRRYWQHGAKGAGEDGGPCIVVVDVVHAEDQGEF